YYYIESYAVLEAFYPLYVHFKRVSEDQQHRVREIFETIRQVFAPESETTFDEIMKKIRWHDTYKTVIDAYKKDNYNDYVRHQWERAAWSYCRYQSWLHGKLEQFRNAPSAQLDMEIKGFIKRRSNREKVVEHAKLKYRPIQSLFNFRGSDVSIRCGIHDPNHLFQNTAEYAEYDLFHVLSHCEFQQIPDKKIYRELTGNWGNHCEFFVQVHRFKNPPHKVGFDYDAGSDNQKDFERQYCWGPVAIKDLRLRLSNGFVPLEIQRILTDRYITCLLSKVENRHALKNILETKRQFAYPLTVTFVDGKQQEYQLILGSQAFLIHAELQGKWKEKEQKARL
ncbi:MAG: hypothetical protein OXT74_17760, partial [Candidatus Poribacteria bacterium]|nr:hypothetical protein [Candidatus Poribacteria bacterium]